jgi:hypothetical protein
MSGIRRNPEPILVEAMGSCTRPVSGSWNLNRTVSVTVFVRQNCGELSSSYSGVHEDDSSLRYGMV